MEAGTTMEVNRILKQYKLPDGSANYPVLFQVPTHERIPALAQIDYQRINMLVIGALTMAFEAMNLKRGMNEMQVLMASEMIIESSSEDNLSLEDVILFLQNMIKGKYDMSYESLDVPKFMKLFEIYRQERHSAILEYRENRHLEYKGLGDANRTNNADPLAEHFSKLGETISGLKERLRETSKENYVLKQMDKL